MTARSVPEVGGAILSLARSEATRRSCLERVTGIEPACVSSDWHIAVS